MHYTYSPTLRIFHHTLLAVCSALMICTPLVMNSSSLLCAQCFEHPKCSNWKDIGSTVLVELRIFFQACMWGYRGITLNA